MYEVDIAIQKIKQYGTTTVSLKLEIQSKTFDFESTKGAK